MKYILLIAAFFITSFAYGQGSWNRATTNNIWNRGKWDSVAIVPRDTSATNNALHPLTGQPVGDYARIQAKHGLFYFHDSIRNRRVAFYDDIPSVTGFVTLATDQDNITGGKTFKGYLDKDRINGTLGNIIGFSTASVAEWNLGNGTAVNDFSLANVTTGIRPWKAIAANDHVEFARSIRIPATAADSNLGVIYKDGWRFFHNYIAPGADGESVYIGRAAGNFTMGIVTIGSESSYNTAVGTEALSGLTSGWSNSMVGYRSGAMITTGKYNTGLGVHALDNTTTTDRNTAVGHYAGFLNVTGAENTIVGASAGRGNTNGNYNCFFGVESGYTANASYNTAYGHFSLNKTTGSFNQAFGKSALQANTTGQENNAFGFGALGANTTGNNNSAFGQNAGSNNITGTGSVFLGFGAGFYETGSNKLFIDNQNRASESDGRVKALIYGVFDALTANQALTINGNAIVNGSFSTPILTVTGTSTLDATHHTIVVNNSGAVAVNLPAASSCSGRIYAIKKISATSNDVTVTRAGADLIDGAITKVLTLQYSSVVIQSTGSGWITLSSHSASTIL